MSTGDKTSKDGDQPLLYHPTTLKLIILSGRSGSGKSSTAYEICHLLKAQKVPHTHIDGDNLNAFYPRDGSPDIMLLNLRKMWDTYWVHFKVTYGGVQEGRVLVVVLSGTSMILNSKEIVNVFTAVVNHRPGTTDSLWPVNIEVSAIVLEAGDEVVEKRLQSREIGGELEEHLVSSSRMNQILGRVQNDEVKRFINNGDNITDLAFEILSHVNVEI
jgi:gluconate kinase